MIKIYIYSFSDLFLRDQAVCSFCVPPELVNVVFSKSYCLVSSLFSRETPLILPVVLWGVICLNLNINNFRLLGQQNGKSCLSMFLSQFHGCLQGWVVQYLTEGDVVHLHQLFKLFRSAPALHSYTQM